MISRRLPSNLEPSVPITLHGRSTTLIDAVLDTGFTDFLCLSRRHRKKMALRKVGENVSAFADGRQVLEPVYLGQVTFDGVRQKVLVTLTNADDSLVGCALLRNKRVHLDFKRRTLTVSG